MINAPAPPAISGNRSVSAPAQEFSVDPNDACIGAEALPPEESRRERQALYVSGVAFGLWGIFLLIMWLFPAR